MKKLSQERAKRVLGQFRDARFCSFCPDLPVAGIRLMRDFCAVESGLSFMWSWREATVPFGMIVLNLIFCTGTGLTDPL